MTIKIVQYVRQQEPGEVDDPRRMKREEEEEKKEEAIESKRVTQVAAYENKKQNQKLENSNVSQN